MSLSRSLSFLVLLSLAVGVPLILAAASTHAAADASCAVDATTPRTLILSLDGVAFDVVEAARAEGAFADWPETRALVSTFPSMTNIAFTAIFAPLEHDKMAGYEMRHYDYASNKILSGSADYAERSGGWRDHYDIMHNSIGSKAKGYLRPRADAYAMMKEIKTLVLEQPREVMLAHIKGTDILAHFRGNDALGEVMLDLAAFLDELAVRHEEKYGRPLRFLLFSDHGNTEQKVYFRKGIKERLRAADLRPRERLVESSDIVTPTYGVVSFGVLFTDPSNARKAAMALIDHEAVDLAAWLIEPGSMGVLSDEGEAVVRWVDGEDGTYYAYDASREDPLKLDPAVLALRRAGSLDAAGFAHEDAWFRRTALEDYPDALRRLVDSLTGTWVRNSATVILSFEPGYAWGQAMVRFGAYMGGGHQEGTHGGLDRDATLGFYLTNDPDRVPDVAVRADRTLEPWTDVLACREPTTRAVPETIAAE